MNVKFMQTVDTQVYVDLKALAKDRGVGVQELLRAVVVPDWMNSYTERKRKSSTARTRKRAGNPN